MYRALWVIAVAVVVSAVPGVVEAQDGSRPVPTTSLRVCDLSIPRPAALPPAGSGPVVYLLIPCFENQDNVSLVPPETYVFYMRLPPSQPSQNLWVPFDEDARQTIREDFWRLWDTNWLDDLSIEIYDYVFENGVIGKVVSYSIEERERIRVVSYEGSDELDRTAIEEQLTTQGIQLNFDTFLDLGQIERVEAVVRSFMAEKGYTNSDVDYTITPTAAGPKVVNVTFNVEQGPKTKIREVEFVGNETFSDGQLRGELQQNKPAGLFSFITGRGTYKVNQYEQDVAALMQYYRNRGYARVRIGQPELRVLETEPDGETQWVQLRIPVTEGPRYRLGRLDFTGNDVLPGEAMRPLFELETGEWYSEIQMRNGLEIAQEIYGTAGYMDFTGFPDLRFSDDADAVVPPTLLLSPGTGDPSTVDVVMRLEEGDQFRVNRLTFVGNDLTHDNVIRREFRLVEGGVYDTQALDFSVRRINQLGYFEPVEVESENLTIERVSGEEDTVDITLRLQEQNRNQLQFGAGVSQYEGFFGQASFSTANFLGRGESLTVTAQGGARTQNYQLSFSEPFLFDRNITGGFDIFKRQLEYIGFYTQKSEGANVTFGFPTFDFSRMFINYSYERAQVSDLHEGFSDPRMLARNPFMQDALLLGGTGQRTISKITPSFIYNTVDNPIFPNTGTKYSFEFDMAGWGGNTSYYKPSAEAVWYRRHTSRTSVGARVMFEFIAPLGDTKTLPIFEKLFLGGEYTIRGYDLRTVGPSDPYTGLVLGGNKSLLFNAEYLIRISDPIRLIFFYDAGQVRAAGQNFSIKEELLSRVLPDQPLLFDPLQQTQLTVPNASLADFQVVGRTSAFKTSTGIEVRFFMPVLNVPFRLIVAKNFQRGNVLSDNLTPAEGTTFKFGVGTTF
jgi:outer membrane protein insertion porin family